MELTFAAAQAEGRLCNCVVLDAMSMVRSDPTTCALPGLTTTREVSIDVHIKDFIRGGVHGLGGHPKRICTQGACASSST